MKIDFNNLNTSTKTKENNKKKHYLIPCVDTKLKLITFLLIILVCFLVLITGIILIIIYAISNVVLFFLLCKYVFIYFGVTIYMSVKKVNIKKKLFIYIQPNKYF